MNKPVKFLKGMEDRLMSHNRKMSGKSLIKAMFVVWIGAIYSPCCYSSFR
jgi:hypothetical protein